MTCAALSFGFAESAALVALSIFCAVAISFGCAAAIAWACGPFSTSVDTVFTMCGTMNTDTAMTMRITRPQIARPVAASAGLRFSTVSVKLAIHGA